VWHGGNAGEPALLASCYRSSLSLAAARGIVSIAFPAISCGVYGYPIEEATAIAVREVLGHLRGNPSFERIVFACFGPPVLSTYRRALAAGGIA
jgi:O-acetyl-ADP-ribose deacetylase (regulator of RNase III)